MAPAGSLRVLENMLVGYSVALDVHGVDEEFAMWPSGPFAMWLQDRMAGVWLWAGLAPSKNTPMVRSR